MRTGFEAASGEIIVAMDADCSMRPSEMLVMVSTLMSGADFVKGSRFMQGGGTSDMTLFRKLGNWGLSKTVRMLFGGQYSDLCYGYFAFWKKRLCQLSPETDGFEVETFINVAALKAGFKVAEVPSFEDDRVHGESKLRAIPDGWRVLKTIVGEKVNKTQRDCDDPFVP
jgi:Glycosyl transferase family 2